MASRKRKPKRWTPSITFADSPELRERQAAQRVERKVDQLEAQRDRLRDEVNILTAKRDQLREPPAPCTHVDALTADDKGFVHWCPDCGAVQLKPAGRWRKPKGDPK